MKNSSGFVLVPVIYYIVAGAAGLMLAVPNLNPFHERPAKAAAAQVDVLVKQQADLDTLRAELAHLNAEKKEADARAETARLLAEQKRNEQMRQGQQYLEGARNAKNRIPATQRTPEVRITGDLIDRASLSLGLALGDLPADKQAEIVALVDSYVAGREADVKAQLDAKDKLVRDAEDAKRIAEAQRADALAQAQTLQGKLATTEKIVTAKDGILHETQTLAQQLTRKAADVELEAGSFKTWANNVLRMIVIYFAFAWGLQLLSKAYPAIPLLGRISGSMLNPLRELEHKAADSFGKDMTGVVEDTKRWLATEGYTPDDITKYEANIVHQWATVKDGTRAKFEAARVAVAKELT